MTGQTGLYPTLGSTSSVQILNVSESMVLGRFRTVTFPVIDFSSVNYKRPLILGFTLRAPLSLVVVLIGYQLTQLTPDTWRVTADYIPIALTAGTPTSEDNTYTQQFICQYVEATFNP